MRDARLILGVPLAVCLACGDAPGPSAPIFLPGFLISDAVHDDGNPHFFWLPPMVGDPGSFNGPFDGSLSPVVRICDLADCANLPVAEFNTSGEPGSESVRVVTTDEHYVVNWHTDEFAVGPGPTYRISVRVAGTELGVADVQLAASGAEAKNLTTEELIGLVDGRTLPIKFRIEEGAVFVISAEGGTVEALGSSVVLQIPPGALSEETGITVKSLPPSGDALVAVEFGPAGLQFPEAVPVTISFDEAALGDVAEADLGLNLLDAAGRWVLMPGSAVDVAANTVTAPFFHFSTGGAAPAALAVFCSGDADSTTFESLPAALAGVRRGGTVEVCDGTHDVDSASVAKPVTVQPAPGAAPVIRTPPTARVSLFVEGVNSGLVTFRDLSFENASPRDVTVTPIKNTYSIYLRNAYDQVVVDNTTFLAQGGTVGSVAASASAVPDARLVVQNSAFEGGRLGIIVFGAPNTDVVDNQFQNHELFAVQLNQTTGQAARNTMSNCGRLNCLRARFGSNVTLVDNVLSEAITGVNPLAHNLIFVDQGSTGRIEGNEIDGCGVGQCILVRNNSTVDVLNNAITVYETHGTRLVVIGVDPGTQLDVSGNTIVGIDQDGNPSTYATEFAAIQAEDEAVVTASANAITHTAIGLTAVTNPGGIGGIIQDARDNVIDGVGTAFNILNGSSLTANFNDVLNTPVHLNVGGGFGTVDVTCNWWGADAPPTTSGDAVPATSYTPWATTLIRGTGATSCSGGL